MSSSCISCMSGAAPSVAPLRLPRFDEAADRRMERRRYLRRDINLAASVSVDEQAWNARCLNLSAGGALLKLEVERLVPETFLLHLVLPVLGDSPVPVVARRIEVRGQRVRLAFDPLPEFTGRAFEQQLTSSSAKKKTLTLLS